MHNQDPKDAFPFSESHIMQQRQLLIQERWPEMAMGCTACLRWDDFTRPECCGDCGIGVRRQQARAKQPHNF